MTPDATSLAVLLDALCAAYGYTRAQAEEAENSRAEPHPTPEAWRRLRPRREGFTAFDAFSGRDSVATVAAWNCPPPRLRQHRPSRVSPLRSR